MATEPTGFPFGGVVYWMVAAFLVVFGILALASIGAPFLVLGVVMCLMWPIRRRPRIFWPVMVGVAAFSLVFLLAAPFGCEREGGVDEEERATCSSYIGVHYSGVGDWDPSYVPAVLAALGVGVIAGAGTAVLVSRRSRTETEPGGSAPAGSDAPA